jgi:hypothetical protein
MATAPPTSEIGSIRDAPLPGLPSWTGLVDDREYVPELRWPNNVIDVFPRMGKDAQVKGLQRSIDLPLNKREYWVNPNGAEDSLVRKYAEDIGLPIMGDEEGDQIFNRRRNRFNFKKHYRDARRALWNGHYPFEIVGEIGDDGLWHLRKLAPRPPRTILEMNVEKDGSLKFIKQNIGYKPPEIPIEHLVFYVWDGEEGDWLGESMLRSIYRNWLAKDRLLRIDVIKQERTGMGTPVAEAAPGASDEEVVALDHMMRAARVTERGGAAVPNGTKVSFVGTTGSVPDTWQSIRGNNEEMATAFLAMFGELGQTQHGSRALGEVLVDHFSLGLDAIEDWFLTEYFNPFVTERWWDYNAGEESQPAVVERRKDEDEDYEVADLVALITAGALQVDDELEEELRERLDLPEKGKAITKPEALNPDGSSRTPPVPEPGVVDPDEEDEGSPPAKARRGSAAAAEVGESPSPLSLPARKLRRQPYDQEIQAAVDYATIDTAIKGGVDQLVMEVNVLQDQQLSDLHDKIVKAKGDLVKLSILETDPVAGDAIKAAMIRAADMGIDQAAGEATRQGVEGVVRPHTAELDDRITARALATDNVLAQELSSTVARQAVRRSADNAVASEVADAVVAHMRSLTDNYLKERLGGALTQAMNDGRKATIGRNNPKRIYSSELLDEGTCEACVSVDGTEYDSIDSANSDYPTGGYSECLGQDKCRGTLVAVYEETL